MTLPIKAKVRRVQRKVHDRIAICGREAIVVDVVALEVGAVFVGGGGGGGDDATTMLVFGRIYYTVA